LRVRQIDVNRSLKAIEQVMYPSAHIQNLCPCWAMNMKVVTIRS